MTTIDRPPCALAAIAADGEAVAGLDSARPPAFDSARPPAFDSARPPAFDSARPPAFDSGTVATIRAVAEDMGTELVTVPAGDG